MKKEIQQRIFIVGCPRSGTTLLQTLLMQHPDIYSFPESHFFVKSLKGKKFDLLKSKKALQDWSEIINLENNQQYNFQYSNLKQKNINEFIKSLDEIALAHDKSIWIEKTPSHLYTIEEIKKYIPDAKFIHLLRNGEDVVASLYEVTQKHSDIWQKKYSIESAVERYNQDVRISMRYLNTNNNFIIRYEEILSSLNNLKKVYEFLDIDAPKKIELTPVKSIIMQNEEWKNNNLNHKVLNTQGKKFKQLFARREQMYIMEHIVKVQYSCYPNTLFSEYLKQNKNTNRVYISHDLWEMKKYNEYLYLLYKDFLNDPKLPEVVYIPIKHYPKMILRRIKGEQSVFHQHWFELHGLKKLYIDIGRFIAFGLYRMIGGKIVWTVHNKYPHRGNYFRLNSIARQLMAKISNKLHVHCNIAIEIMKDILKVRSEDFFVVKHPDYEASFLAQKDALALLVEKYSEDVAAQDFLKYKKIYLIFGQVSKYKGILELTQQWNKIADKDSMLLIAGMTKKGDENYKELLRKEVESNDHTVWIDQFIPDSDIPIFLNSTDSVIFNYQDILTSGGVVLAQSYNKPVIAPKIGCLQELDGDLVVLFEHLEELRL